MTSHLDPKVLDKVSKLELRARLVVEGFIAGMHRSPYRGASVEFAQHREYVPGDDIRRLDWKVAGRSDRLFVKEYEEETNLRTHLLVDQSESMRYGHEDGATKFDHAATAAAAVAFLVQQQSDAVGLTLFDETRATTVPPSNTRQNLGAILKALAEAQPTRRTRIGDVLHELANQVRQRSMVLVFSDLFDDPQRVVLGLREVAQRGHDVIVMHVLDRHEVEFPFERMTLFEGMENLPELLVEPRALKDAYLEEVNRFVETVRRGCHDQRIEYAQLLTHQPLDVALSSYLAARGARAKRRK